MGRNGERVAPIQAVENFCPVATIFTNQGQQTEMLPAERRRKWISVISGEDITDTKFGE